MTIFETAMKMEKDGEQYYREMAEKCQIMGLKNILNLLAEDESGHYKVFEALQKDTVYKRGGTMVLTESKNIFQRMREANEVINLEGSPLEMYNKALELESESESYYRDMVKKVESEAAKALLLRVANEEKKHASLILNVIDFLSAPANWLENAEFNNLEEF